MITDISLVLDFHTRSLWKDDWTKKIIKRFFEGMGVLHRIIIIWYKIEDQGMT